jgi:hypothetical protein
MNFWLEFKVSNSDFLNRFPFHQFTLWIRIRHFLFPMVSKNQKILSQCLTLLYLVQKTITVRIAETATLFMKTFVSMNAHKVM